jgi:hypothetical protein
VTIAGAAGEGPAWRAFTREFDLPPGVAQLRLVFGAARPGGAAPRVDASFELRRADGETLRKAPPTPIAPGADGRLVRTVGTSLESFEEGAYELVLKVHDEVSGDSLVRQEPFVLARAGN